MIQLCGYDAELSSVFAQDDYVFWRHKFIRVSARGLG